MGPLPAKQPEFWTFRIFAPPISGISENPGSGRLCGDQWPESTTPERLFAWLADIPIQAQPNLGAEGYAAELFRVLAQPEPSGALARETYDLAAVARSKSASRSTGRSSGIVSRTGDGNPGV